MGLFDRLRDSFESWGKRREEREREFFDANTGWARPAQPVPAKSVAPRVAIDREGLQAAFLDQSGRIAYYLDLETGEVVDHRESSALPAPRYRRIPARASGADAADRRAFVDSLEPSPRRDRLAAARDPVEFRRGLSEDRNEERAWYIFRNDRATAAVEKWLKGELKIED